MTTSLQRPWIHVDLRCDPTVAEAADRMLDRLDSVIGEDALTGLRAAVERRANRERDRGQGPA